MQHQSYPPFLVGNKVETESGKFIVVWCPVCNIHHTHKQNELGADFAQIEKAQCSTGALVDTGYYTISVEGSTKLFSVPESLSHGLDNPAKKAKKK